MKLPSHIAYILGLIGVAICAGIAAAILLLGGCATCQWTEPSPDVAQTAVSSNARVWLDGGDMLVVAKIPNDPASVVYMVETDAGYLIRLLPAFASYKGKVYRWDEIPCGVKSEIDE